MNLSDFPEIENLSTPEKILLLEQLWDSIVSDEDDVPVPESHLRELRRRYRAYKAGPGEMLTLDELKERIERRK